MHCKGWVGRLVARTTAQRNYKSRTLELGKHVNSLEWSANAVSTAQLMKHGCCPLESSGTLGCTSQTRKTSTISQGNPPLVTNVKEAPQAESELSAHRPARSPAKGRHARFGPVSGQLTNKSVAGAGSTSTGWALPGQPSALHGAWLPSQPSHGGYQLELGAAAHRGAGGGDPQPSSTQGRSQPALRQLAYSERAA